MIQYFRRVGSGEGVVRHDGIVVRDPVGQQVVVRRQVCVHHANVDSVSVHPHAHRALVSLQASTLSQSGTESSPSAAEAFSLTHMPPKPVFVY